VQARWVPLDAVTDLPLTAGTREWLGRLGHLLQERP
jgi:hypothetical protein